MSFLMLKTSLFVSKSKTFSLIPVLSLYFFMKLIFFSEQSKQTGKSEKELLEEKKKNLTFKISSVPKLVHLF